MMSVCGFVVPVEPTIYLIGDSTMADKPLTGSPERGWGQVFPLYFRPGIRIENHAKNGRSTKSFIREGRWATVCEKLQPGDYVLMQFGHNDAKKEDSTRFADAHTDYKTNLLMFIRETQAKGAHPVLITPVVRRRFDAEGKFYDVHGDYPGVVRELGSEENVPVIDLWQKSMDLLKQLGAEDSKRLFLSIRPGEYSAVPAGKQDDTHFSWYGAATIARLVVEEIHRLQLPLTEFLRTERLPEFVGIGHHVLLDCFYNNEWKKDPDGRLVRYHYVWDDTANSGFSMLAKIVAQMGCTMDTLPNAPTADVLKRASLYIIVDPDTPQETQQPNYIDDRAVQTIAGWMREGGILVLLGNDKGNAEFEHLNQLAAEFGIHFNEDSRNRVTGRQFEIGTFDKLPRHPVFEGVKRLFIKELSTLKLQEPAHAVLSDNDEVIMAFANFGKGGVFAVGDPWFYNEYMDERRLPAGYDNARAAENLFHWLLSLAVAPRLN